MTAMNGLNFGIALAGVILATVALWHQFHQTRVRLRVIPKFTAVLTDRWMTSTDQNSLESFAKASRDVGWSIEVVNLSSFAVTIAAVGFGNVDEGRRLAKRPAVFGGKKFPTRLESRESAICYLGSTPFPANGKFPYAFAATECDVVVYGTSAALKRWLRLFKEAVGQAPLAGPATPAATEYP